MDKPKQITVEGLKQFKEYYLAHPVESVEKFMGIKLSLWQKIYLSVLDKTRRHK